ncbi:hypothetical protein B0H13DRAFT_1872763 [Mycena leptocephala]|nr:hypothetical protein B0H13DRAFT_1872763 [Mycena leptocephala]
MVLKRRIIRTRNDPPNRGSGSGFLRVRAPVLSTLKRDAPESAAQAEGEVQVNSEGEAEVELEVELEGERKGLGNPATTDTHCHGAELRALDTQSYSPVLRNYEPRGMKPAKERCRCKTEDEEEIKSQALKQKRSTST